MAAEEAVNAPGPVVDVLLGGYLASRRGFEGLRAAMEDASGNRTIFVEPVRWGRTIFWNHPAYPRAFFRQALHAALELRALGVRRVRLYGMSMGAPIVMIMAEAFGRVFTTEQVVLINPACVHIDGVMPLGRRVIRKAQADMHNLRYHPDEAVRRIMRDSRRGAAFYMTNLVRATAEGLAISRIPLFTQTLPRLEQKRIPVYVAHAELDLLFTADCVASALVNLPEGRVFLLEGIGHDAQFVPAQTAAALKRHGVL